MARYDDDDDDDAFDENGLLKDGRRMRVSMMMRDSTSDVQRAVAEDAVARRFGLRHALELHQPGPRYCTDAAGQRRARQAYQEMCDDLQNAWRNATAAGCAAPPRHHRCTRDTAPARPVYDAPRAAHQGCGL